MPKLQIQKVLDRDGRKERSPNISKDRLEVEKLLMSEGYQVMNTHEIGQSVGVTSYRASKILAAMKYDGVAVNIKKGGGVGLWIMSEIVKNPEAFKKPFVEQVRNGNQPNGSSEYWSKNHAALMGSPRL